MIDTNPWWKGYKYSHIKIPKALFRNPKYENISPLSKLLYGFLLDRTSLSYASGKQWQDDDGNFFVYFPLSEISERLSCGHDKATGLLKELADAGLIRRIRQKPGCPYKLVVLPFDSYPAKPDTSLRGNRKSKSDFQESEPCEKSAGNKTEDNNPDMNKPDLTYAYQRDDVETQIKQNIYYDILKQDLPVTQLDRIVSLMVDTICTTGKIIKISGEAKPREEVRRRFLALNDIHIRYVFERMKEESNIVHYPRGYLLARLYEAEEVMDTYYQIRVNHDMKAVNY